MYLSRARGPVLSLLGVFFVVAPLFLLTASRSTTSTDVYGASFAGWHLAATGSSDMTGYSYRPPGGDFELVDRFATTTAHGELAVPRGPGLVLVCTVAYALAGITEFAIWPQAIAAALLTAASVTLLFSALRRVVPTRTALVGTGAVAFASPVWTVAGDGMWTHTITLLGIAGMARAAATQQWWLVGLAGGVALWGRAHVAVIVAVLGLGLAWSLRDRGIAIRVAVPSLAFMGLASLWTHWMYGRWEPTGGYGADGYLLRFGDASMVMGNRLVNELGLWIAPDRGILVWTPLVLMLLPAVVRGWPTFPAWTRWLLTGGLAYTVMQGWFSGFHGGDAFYGYRLGLEFLMCAAPALACAWAHAGRVSRAVAPAVIGVQAVAFGIGASVEGLFIDQTRAWRANALVAAVDRAPVIGLLLVLGAILGLLARRLLQSRVVS